MQSRFSDIEFSDNLWFSDYFTKKLFFNSLHKIIQFSDIMRFSDVFADTKSVTKSRFHKSYITHCIKKDMSIQKRI